MSCASDHCQVSSTRARRPLASGLIPFLRVQLAKYYPYQKQVQRSFTASHLRIPEGRAPRRIASKLSWQIFSLSFSAGTTNDVSHRVWRSRNSLPQPGPGRNHGYAPLLPAGSTTFAIPQTCRMGSLGGCSIPFMRRQVGPTPPPPTPAPPRLLLCSVAAIVLVPSIRSISCPIVSLIGSGEHKNRMYSNRGLIYAQSKWGTVALTIRMPCVYVRVS